ncbi:MAG TPA: hypothetical protein VMV41_08175, partial [Cellulomonadaceae bacterium]|nr:hypothetical protein [Cellulomonadaceae bacterium]
MSQRDAPLTEPTTFRPLPTSVVLSPTTLGRASAVTFTMPHAPAGARAALLNVTASRSTTPTRISACAGTVVTAGCRETTGLTARPGSSGSSLVIAPLGGPNGNQTTLFNALGDVTMTADLSGYFVTSTAADTPLDSLLAPIATSAAVSELDVRPGAGSVVDLPDVPPGATAAIVDLEATGAATTTSLSVCPVGVGTDACTATTALSTDGPQAQRNLVVVPLSTTSTSQIAIRSSDAAVRTSVAVQGYFVRGGDSSPAGRLYATNGPDLLAWQGIDAEHDVTLTLPRLPRGALAVSLRVTGVSAGEPASLSVCPGSTSSASCAQTGVVTVAPLEVAASNYTLVQLDPDDPTHVTLRATGSAVTVRVEMRGYVAPDAPGPGMPVGDRSPSAGVSSGTGSTTPTGPAVVPASPGAPQASTGSTLSASSTG